MAPMRSVAIVLVTCRFLTRISWAFQASLLPNPRTLVSPSERVVRYDTSVHMGLRTFLKTKLGRRKESDDAESSLDDTKSTPTIATEKPTGIKIPTQPPKQKVQMEQDDTVVSASKSSRLPPLRQESAKDRLNRVRSGKMTDDEKQAFLRTALSAGDKSTSRKPLRQKVPDESRPRNITGNATPYPKDSLLSNMARGWSSGYNSTVSNDSPLRNWKSGSQLEDQKKKREYYEMVTNPNRFHTYKSSMVTQPGETDKVDPTVHDGLVIPQAGEETHERGKILEEEVIEDIRAYEEVAGVEGDLGARLEKAAHALEEAAKQRELERKEKEKRLEKQREEQRARLFEIQRKQQLEMEKRELELKAKKREEEEAAAIEAEKKRKEEAARRRKLEEAQDAYWAKKLEAEKKARMQGMSKRQQEEFMKHEIQAEEKAIEIAEQEKQALEAMEQQVQKSDAVDARIDIAAADYLTKSTTKQDSYEAMREKKRREAERARDEQIAKLKALNSPLPSTRSTASPGVQPASFTPPAPAPPMMPKTEPTVADMMSDIDVGDELDEDVVPVKSSAGQGFLSRVMGSSKQKESPAPKAAPEPKRIVRQQLPLGDEDDEFDTFDRNGPNRKMSIADAMSAAGASASASGNPEQRSKMWGVDMSRISKSLEDEKKQGK